MRPDDVLNELLQLDGDFDSLYEAVLDEVHDDETRRLFDRIAIAFDAAIRYLREA